jgi:hypothetical protein
MKKFSLLLFLMAMVVTWSACNRTETYAEQKERERNAVNAYLVKEGVHVIDETTFKNQNYTTDLERNEFVLFESTGVYMQILNEGCGEKLKDGETATVLCRFSERNLLTDTLQLSNNVFGWSAVVDKMYVTKNGITYTASFDTSSSVMYRTYSSASVPAGWLVPLTYIKLGRPSTAEEDVALVKLIVPHTQGQSNAASSVYPCLYELSYQRGR